VFAAKQNRELAGPLFNPLGFAAELPHS